MKENTEQAPAVQPKADKPQRNYASFLRMVQRQSGLTLSEFSRRAKVNINTIGVAMQRGSILWKTALKILSNNGYVAVFDFKIPNTEEAVLIDDIKDNPFDVDWENYKSLEQLKTLFRNEPDLMKQVTTQLGITERAIRYYFQNDNGDIRRIFDIAEHAGLKVRILIKKDPASAAILAKRLEKDKEEN